MSGLKGILEEARDRGLKAGGTVSTGLIRKVRDYRQRQFYIFLAVELVIVGGVAFCAWYLVRNPANSVQVKVLAGLLGIGAGGGIEVIRRIWKEWSQADLLLVLIEEASEAQVTTILDRLIAKL